MGSSMVRAYGYQQFLPTNRGVDKLLAASRQTFAFSRDRGRFSPLHFVKLS